MNGENGWFTNRIKVFDQSRWSVEGFVLFLCEEFHTLGYIQIHRKREKATYGSRHRLIDLNDEAEFSFRKEINSKQCRIHAVSWFLWVVFVPWAATVSLNYLAQFHLIHSPVKQIWNGTFVYSACNDSATFFSRIFLLFSILFDAFCSTSAGRFSISCSLWCYRKTKWQGNLQRTSGYQPKLVVAPSLCI